MKLEYHKFCSQECSHMAQRQTTHPSAEQLGLEIKEFSWTALGKKYGVSDNAVRKWAKKYEDYILYHDCGKPFCHTVDADGKSHFPNHAEVSQKVFLEAGGNETSAKLIGWDMLIHSANSEEIENYCKIWSIQDAFTLLFVALSEVHANAKMFGPEGIESTSFKIKWKKIDQRGKQIMKFYKDNNHAIH